MFLDMYMSFWKKTFFQCTILGIISNVLVFWKKNSFLWYWFSSLGSFLIYSHIPAPFLLPLNHTRFKKFCKWELCCRIFPWHSGQMNLLNARNHILLLSLNHTRFKRFCKWMPGVTFFCQPWSWKSNSSS